jgi:hypothetical protein
LPFATQPSCYFVVKISCAYNVSVIGKSLFSISYDSSLRLSAALISVGPHPHRCSRSGQVRFTIGVSHSCFGGQIRFGLGYGEIGPDIDAYRCESVRSLDSKHCARTRLLGLAIVEESDHTNR